MFTVAAVSVAGPVAPYVMLVLVMAPIPVS